MKNIVLALMTLFALVACTEYRGEQSAVRQESAQQEVGMQSLIQNQPVPDLGGYSFERELVRQVYIARNKRVVATWTYFQTLDGGMIEVCPSIGYPIPYAVQLTNPVQIVDDPNGSIDAGSVTLGNPEPNGLYSPSSAEASWIQCANSDGSISPVYAEPRTVTMPYRIKATSKLERITNSTTFKLNIKTK